MAIIGPVDKIPTADAFTVNLQTVTNEELSKSFSKMWLTDFPDVAATNKTAMSVDATSPTGHMGLQRYRLLLVDHRNNYHYGQGSRIEYCGRFLLIDDIAVFRGNALFPAFNSKQYQQMISPTTETGLKIGAVALWVKLLQTWHPAATGLLTCLVFSILAIAVALQ